MTAEKQRRYRFFTEAQWSSCIISRADADSLRTASGIRPLTPYAHLGALYEAREAHAPVVTRAGEILWVDGQNVLHRMLERDDEPMAANAPLGMTRTRRIVATSSGLWVFDPNRDSLANYDEESLTRRLVVELPDLRLLDIATDGHDCVLVLVDDHGAWKALRIDQAGRVVETIELTALSHATEFVFLRRSRRFVVLSGEDHQRLIWFSADERRQLFSVTVAALRPCFTPSRLGSDGRDRVLLAGADACMPGAGAHVLVLDADGNLVDDVPLDRLDAPASGVVAKRDSLFVTGPRGLLRFGAAESVPEGAGNVGTTLITPMLYSPDREDARRWLRVDASAHIPEGSSIEIVFAATDDAETRDRLNATATNAAMSASLRVDTLLGETELWGGRTVFAGSDGASGSAATYSAKLFDVRAQYLWVAVTLIAAPGARLPVLSELNVLYPGLTLMEKLPAIYQQDEAEADSFLRSFVGVLETTTQDIDERIASMGSNVHPSTATVPWLDFIARWLGVPWDDGLDAAQKKEIVRRAPELARGRGTRAGLEALLECLLPGTPSRFRVTDATADHGFAIVGGESCTGSVLPAMLGGRTRWSAELDSRAVLGYTRLPCPSQLDDGAWHLAGVVRIELAATSAQRATWEPWFRALVTEMIPASARLELRWVSQNALRTDTLDGTLTLKSAPAPHLGVDAVADLARLPERGTRLSASGSNISTRLR